ncbi:unnamed protein product [Oppiella nova]|uniref:DNA (cytosine-5-)-methyltransferase n=1 Tax=Oppiella nova TaxID=334625 RepID=A0A7R9QFM9_9ACAR|nr:unnamed protein product [Oppiella nova]CAG2164397.1 unnamed protein product [Oppiella nova]
MSSSEVPLDLSNESKDKTPQETKLSIHSNVINGENNTKSKRKTPNVTKVLHKTSQPMTKRQKLANSSSSAADVNPLQRGKYGLRLLPPQVDYYQSVLEDRRIRSYKEPTQAIPESIKNEPKVETKHKPKPRQTVGKYEFEIGDIVWATLPNYKTWFPALIISHLHCKQKAAKKGQTWVYWFGDHQVSEIHKSKIKSFVPNFSELSKGTSSLTSLRMKEALQVLASRAGVDFESDAIVATSSTCTDEEKSALISWARSGFQVKSGLTPETAFKADPLNPIPTSAASYLPLDSVYSESLKTDERLQQIVYYEVERTESTDSQEIPEYKVSQIDRIQKKEVAIARICIACCCDAEALAGSESRVLLEHPIFEGGLCRLCYDNIRVTMYAPGDDHKNSFCAICGQLGKLAICENEMCHRVYCLKCIDLLVGSGVHLKVLEMEKWECFVCKPNTQEMGLLRVRTNWRFNVKALFDPLVNGLKSLNTIQEPSNDKKQIRVLSLMDGISSAKIALEKLGLKVDAYYSSESNTNAIEISKNYNKNSVVFVDSIENLTLEKIVAMGPIDLVLGSSPPEYSSNASIRKSLIENKGSGHYFLYFNHILHLIRLTNKSRHIFFLCENSNPLSNSQRDVISNLFMCKPITLFANNSPHNRNRYYWSNIPGIKRPLPQTIQEKFISLINILTQNISRKTTSDKKSLESDSEDKNFEPKELEKLFELPEGYTDINSLATDTRQGLLTRSWCVSILSHLIWSLTDFFITEQKSK